MSKIGKLLIFILGLLILALLYFLFLYFSKNQNRITLINNSSKVKLSLNNRDLLNTYLNDWQLWNKKGIMIYNSDFESKKSFIVKSLTIELVDDEQAYGWTDESGDNKLISYSHTIKGNNLHLKVNIMKDQLELNYKDEQYGVVSAGIANALYLITHPSPEFDRQVVLETIKTQNSYIRRNAPIFKY